MYVWMKCRHNENLINVNLIGFPQTTHWSDVFWCCLPSEFALYTFNEKCCFFKGKTAQNRFCIKLIQRVCIAKVVPIVETVQ